MGKNPSTGDLGANRRWAESISSARVPFLDSRLRFRVR